MPTTESSAPVFLSTDAFRAHWQGHRRLTRRVIQAFPDDALFTHAVGGMRPFAELALEMIGMVLGGMSGVVTGTWPDVSTPTDDGFKATTKADLLRLWDQATVEIETQWPRIAPARFHEVDMAFGLYEGTNVQTLLYFIDNEIHHRGQGYVYLRSLGIQPPGFYER